jgi:succinate dehydrogenase / fumarate reductase cytochrome b subunit
VKKRPINLNLFSVRFPITAIVSILHRMSGVFLFLIIPGLLWGLQCSLSDSASIALKKIGSGLGFKLFIWLTLSSLFYHLFAGLRHLIMDMGWGESLGSARITAKAVLVLSVFYSIGLGIWLWF